MEKGDFLCSGERERRRTGRKGEGGWVGEGGKKEGGERKEIELSNEEGKSGKGRRLS